jgi:alpha-tubulin suppressor-like RCC1 family protein
MFTQYSTRVLSFASLVLWLLEISCGGPAGDTTAPPPQVASVVVSPAAPTVEIGATTQLTAMPKDASGAVLFGRAVTWFSNNSGVASVSAGGLVTAIGLGATTVTATSEGKVGAADITVQATVSTVFAGPTNVIIPVGSTVQMMTIIKDNSGTVVVGRPVTWSSLDPALVSVTATGLATTLGTGSARISAESGGKTGIATLTVTPQAPIGAVASLTPDDLTTCAVNSSGAGFCWGVGDAGQLGNGDIKAALSPVPVSGGLTFSSISPAIYHTCGLTTNGAAYCWGRNDQGELGDGSTTQRLTPTAVLGGHVFSQIRTAFHFSCGLEGDGTAYCWGDGQFGALGNGFTSSSVPVTVTGGLKFKSIDPGFWHVCAISLAGGAYCWGRNVSGELGEGTTTNRPAPTAVSGASSFIAVSAGERNSCGLSSTGAAFCWGARPAGLSAVSTPVAVDGGRVFVSIDMGNGHACGLQNDGSAYCWGGNGRGENGDGTNTLSATPVAVSGGLTFASIRGGLGFSCGLTRNGVAYCWGRNDSGMLGIGSNIDTNAPARVAGQP